MAHEFSQDPRSAGEDFRQARRRAALQEIMSHLTGRSAELLSYEEVRQKLRGLEGSAKVLKDIPLAAIVGSVGRYREFTRSFLPRKTIRSDRWVRVKMAMTSLRGVPPIEVYQIGKVYFVQDGNHRVSVARQMGLTQIQAYVTEVKTKVPLSPEIQPDELILKAEYTDFLAHTRLNERRPGVELSVTVPGRYPVLLEHIDVHRYFLGLEQKREVPYEEAVIHWYDTVYLPVVQVIRERGILRDFPHRTEADLYLFISQHRAELEEALGWEISAAAAATDLTDRFNLRSPQTATPARKRLRAALTADEKMELNASQAQAGKAPQAARREQRVVTDILVAIDGKETGWNTLEQAFVVARREGARLQGLHVVSSGTQRNSEWVQRIQAEFKHRCQTAGMRGRLAIDVGERATSICERARWTDLVIASLTHSLPTQRLVRLGSEFRTLIQHCPRPVLAVPETPSSLDQVLLAYDGSPKAEEALYIATYLAGWWNTALVVVTVSENGSAAARTQVPAKRYLKMHAVQAEFRQEKGLVADSILKTAEVHKSNLILMGGYGVDPPLEVVLGSTVDQVLRESLCPVLICR